MRQALLKVDGVVTAQVSYDDKQADVRYRPDVVEPGDLVKSIEDIGFDARVMDSDKARSR